jgi:tetratricopeptide (TPR) repeat protein
VRPSTRSQASSPVAVALVLALAATAVARPDKEKAREHFNQAEMFMMTGVYDQAAIEYQKAYEHAPKAHGFLFNIGLAHEKAGAKKEAVRAYAQYLEKDPRGKKVAEARARMIALERAIEAERRKPPAEPDEPEDTEPGAEDPAGPDEPAGGIDGEPVMPGQPLRGPAITAPAPSSSGLSWGRLAIGAAAVATGLLLDVVPGSARNGEIDALDFLPLGFYGAGAFFVLTGVF